ncbi:FDLD family class I lanthipeptide [Tumebacillus sp. ITR2]|uniref:FDLD family class I lanthipeptide n=1 Tax=Tumebacillus amylolyticus TaxID=2801339 RepID=A0ABS1JCU2_9BACL|nr:FDLD family class I lanthipeptide [Tumebacillus amylolyticus]MBL0388092.1 FDLD family class I lanthipeptide [Tumebacillus amylolyticus]
MENMFELDVQVMNTQFSNTDSISTLTTYLGTSKCDAI